MVIDPKQMPNEVVEALYAHAHFLGDRSDARRAAAAMLAAWPGAIKGRSLFDGEPTLFLPLQQAHIEARSADPDEITRLTADVKRLKGVQQKVYSALLDEREKVARLTAALENVMPIAESYLAIMPDRRGRITETVDSARAALKGGQDDR